MWMKGRSYSIYETSAIEGDVEEYGGARKLSAVNPHGYVMWTQVRIASNTERILSTRVLNSGSAWVAPEIFSML